MEQCGLEELKATGRFFTWTNKQGGNRRVLSKIDRVLGNEIWADLFPNSEVIFLPEEKFDHTPMVLRTFPIR